MSSLTGAELIDHRKCWCGGSVSTKPGAPPVSKCLDSEFHEPFSTGRPEKVRKLYVAGPMTGYPQNNYPEFNRITSTLRDAGYEVVNPADFGADGGHYVDLLRKDLQEMLLCQGIAYHGDWWESSGARNEVTVAGLLRMPCRPWNQWLDRAYMELDNRPEI